MRTLSFFVQEWLFLHSLVGCFELWSLLQQVHSEQCLTSPALSPRSLWHEICHITTTVIIIVPAQLENKEVLQNFNNCREVNQWIPSSQHQEKAEMLLLRLWKTMGHRIQSYEQNTIGKRCLRSSLKRPRLPLRCRSFICSISVTDWTDSEWSR